MLFYFRGPTVTYLEEVIPASSELYMVHRQADAAYAKGTKITSFLPQRKKQLTMR